MKRLLLFAFAVCVNTVVAQPAIEWQKSYGGSNIDVPRALIQTLDGGYVSLGGTKSNNQDVAGLHGDEDAWLVKTAPNGAIEWQRALGGSLADRGNAVVQNPDGTYVLLINTRSADGDMAANFEDASSISILKLDAQGNTIWTRFIGSDEGEVYAFRIIRTATGYVLMGDYNFGNNQAQDYYGEMDVWLIWIDFDGNLVGEKTLGGNYDDLPGNLALSDDGYVVSGYTNSTTGMIHGLHGDNYDAFVAKTGFDGNPVWQKSVGGNAHDYSYDVLPVSDGGFICVGFTSSNDGDVSGNHGNSDGWIFKLDPSGNLLWSKTYGGPLFDGFIKAVALPDGTVVASGFKNASNEGYQGALLADLWVLKIDSNGTVLWEDTFGGTGTDYGFDLAPTADGGFIVSSATNSVDGDVSQALGNYDIWLAKFPSEALSLDRSIAKDFSVYPNPVSNTLYWQTANGQASSATLTNLFGQPIAQSDNGTIDMSRFETGIYLMRLTQDGKESSVQKIVKK